ncbi:hypothetical protein BDY17DRAFT_306399 [Neohortaea acidophila]|uniref:Zn(2)-C6 fungal-type domain-containing protein n=1 Tax=Neohortaea acidophila TaxID=245834 RepID=A0A6A6PEN0_9PEZI|nr:uncharacterized protein BDY17DRAFT_306399 [Neohortaea acidophila]KAF2478428.1 hypothetical protein BDY17DRAFT_306399 [Neohortaea acidophila]
MAPSTDSSTPFSIDDGSPAAEQTPSNRKRHLRAAQACDLCREKKRACDEGRPCINCDKNALTCRYSTSKSTRYMSDIDATFRHLEEHTAKLHTHMQLLDDYLPRFDRLAARLDSAEQNESHANHSDFLLRDSHHAAGVRTLIKLWPSVNSLLCPAHCSVDPVYVLSSEAKDVPAHHHPYAHRVILPGESLSSQPSLVNDFIVMGYRSDPEIIPTSPEHMVPLRRLFRSYVENMHSLHPAVDLQDAFHSFEQLFGETRHPCLSHSDEMIDLTHGSGQTPRMEHMSSVNGGDNTLLSRHRISPLESARLYLILALGDICAYKQNLTFPRSYTQPLVDGAASSSSFQSDAPPVEDRMMFPQSANPFAPKTCADGDFADIPGAKFYDQATYIAGPFQGGNDLIHAQIALLAGLYKAQIGQVRESFNWVTSACRSVLHLLRQFQVVEVSSDILLRNEFPDVRSQGSYRGLQARVKSAEHDLVVLIAWSCIQLEGDILADLPYPESGILACEDLLPWPIRIPGSSQFYQAGGLSCNTALMYFSSQLWLQKHLNLLQNELHGRAGKTLSAFALQKALCEHRSSLTLWRSGLPIDQAWLDSEAPPADIHTARLRAKYWSACFLADQPYLDYVLHKTAVDAHGQTRTDTDGRLFEAISTLPEAEKMAGAQRCIQAAFQSARAFDGIASAVIETNMHGIAHEYGFPVFPRISHRVPGMSIC